MLELTGLGDRVAELAVLVEATHEEIVKHADANLLEFRNHRLGPEDRFVNGIKNQSDADRSSGGGGWIRSCRTSASLTAG